MPDFVRRLISLWTAVSFVLATGQVHAASQCSDTVTGDKDVKVEFVNDPRFDRLETKGGRKAALRRLISMSGYNLEFFESARNMFNKKSEITLAQPLKGGWLVEFVYRPIPRDTKSQNSDQVLILKETTLIDAKGDRVGRSKGSQPIDVTELEYRIPREVREELVGNQKVQRPASISGEVLNEFIKWCEAFEMFTFKDIPAIQNAASKTGYVSMLLRYRGRQLGQFATKRTAVIAFKSTLFLTAFAVVSTLWKEPISYSFPWAAQKHAPQSAAIEAGLQTPYVVLKSAIENRDPVSLEKDGHFELIESYTTLEEAGAKSKITVLAGVDIGKGKSTSFFTGTQFHNTGVIVLTHFNHEAEKTKTYVIEQSKEPGIYNIIASVAGHVSMQRGK
ncbi:MAG: hypothetical protein ABL958_08565 [Bdellovibrionia bacterium]